MEKFTTRIFQVPLVPPPHRSSNTRTTCYSPRARQSFSPWNTNYVPRSSHTRTSNSPSTARFSPRSTKSPPCKRTSYSSPDYHTSKPSYYSPVASSTPKHYSILSTSRHSHNSSRNTISPSPAKSAKKEMTFDGSFELYPTSYGVYSANTKEAADVLVQMSTKRDKH